MTIETARNAEVLLGRLDEEAHKLADINEAIDCVFNKNGSIVVFVSNECDETVNQFEYSKEIATKILRTMRDDSQIRINKLKSEIEAM